MLFSLLLVLLAVTIACVFFAARGGSALPGAPEGAEAANPGQVSHAAVPSLSNETADDLWVLAGAANPYKGQGAAAGMYPDVNGEA